MDDDKVDLDALFYEKPSAAIEQALGNFEKKLRAEYEVNNLWQLYAVKHPGHLDHVELVDQTLEQNFDTLGQLPVAEAMDRLAQLVDAKLPQDGGGPRRERDPESLGEALGLRSQARRRAMSPQVPEDRGQTLGDAIKARKELRRAAHRRLKGY
jgi:hypothetical protein